jgi:hypothetical protein
MDDLDVRWRQNLMWLADKEIEPKILAMIAYQR